MNRDYAIKMRDGDGREVIIPIVWDSIGQALLNGSCLEAAREDVEGNAFWKAVERGEISLDAWLVERMDFERG